MFEALRPALALAPALAPWAVLVTFVAVVLRAWQPFQVMRDRKEESEVVRLTERVNLLEAIVAALQAEIGVLRNESAILDVVLILAKNDPDKLKDAIPDIEKRRRK